MAMAIITSLAYGCKKEEPSGGGGNEPGIVAVTGVTLNKSSLSLVVGGSESLTATVAPSNATNKAVSWKSSDAAVATVDNSGKVTAVKAGSATITVTTSDGSKTATCSVTVTAKAVSVTGVSLDKSSLNLKVGESQAITAKVSPDNASDKKVTWSSSDSKVATVDDNGKVSAVAPGTAVITVKTSDGGKTATCSVTVEAISVEGVSVEPKTLELKEGQTGDLKAVITPSNAANKEVTWRSGSESIATVDQTGKVTAVKEGQVKIYAKSADGGKEAYCDVTVKADDSLKGIAFSVNQLNISAGQTTNIEVVYTPANAADKSLTWSSSNTSVATVSSNGEVTGVAAGETTITATSNEGGFEATCRVIVSEPMPTGVYWSEGDAIFLNGECLFPNRTYPNACMDMDGNIYYGLSENSGCLYKNKTKIYDKSYPYEGLTAAGGGYYFTPYTDAKYTTLRVTKLSDNGELSDIHLFSASEEFAVRVSDVAADKDGNFYVSGNIKKSSTYLAVIWKIARDNEVTRMDVIEGSIETGCLAITVSESGDLYYLATDGSRSNKGFFILYYYKNGKKQYSVSEQFSKATTYPCGIAVRDNHVYVLVNEYDFETHNTYLKVYKDGFYNHVMTMETNLYGGNIFVTKNGDIYCSGHSLKELEQTFILWKNGEMVYTSNKVIKPRSLFVKE